MAETTTLRLMAAAKEFNIGKDTLVEFLAGKGFNRDDLKPTSKLTEKIYRSLKKKFQGIRSPRARAIRSICPKEALKQKRKKKKRRCFLNQKTSLKSPPGKNLLWFLWW